MYVYTHTYVGRRRPRLRLRLQSGSCLLCAYPLLSPQLECCMPYESHIELAGRLISVCHYLLCELSNMPSCTLRGSKVAVGNPWQMFFFIAVVMGNSGDFSFVRKVLREFAYFTRISETWRMVKVWGLDGACNFLSSGPTEWM